MKTIKKELQAYSELHWWNMRKKTLAYKGNLKGLLKYQKIRYSKKKTDIEGIYLYTFKSENGITFKAKGTINDFRHFAKQMVQMELVRMGDKSQLLVSGSWRPLVNVNF